jgi:two-component system, cell cycle sensor histidine kinase and response regulator CckA
MGGKEAVKKILEINENAKIIVSSGYASGSTLSDYKSFGFVDMIGKPYTMTNLREVIARVLNDNN